MSSALIQKTLDNIMADYQKYESSPEVERTIAHLERILEFDIPMTEAQAAFQCGWSSCEARAAFVKAGLRDPEPILPLKAKQPSGWITREDKVKRRLGGPRRQIIRRSRRIANM